MVFGRRGQHGPSVLSRVALAKGIADDSVSSNRTFPRVTFVADHRHNQKVVTTNHVRVWDENTTLLLHHANATSALDLRKSVKN